MKKLLYILLLSGSVAYAGIPPHVCQRDSFSYSDSSFRVGSIRILSISFRYAANTYFPEDQPYVAELATFLKNHPGIAVDLSVHTDYRESNEERSTFYSRWRADALRDSLLSLGVCPEQVTATGRENKEPVYTEVQINTRSNPDEKERMRQANRRTEIRIIAIKEESYCP